MATTASQKNNFVSSFRTWTEDYRRIMDRATVLAGLYTDLTLSGGGLTNVDLTGDNEGLVASEVQAALTTAGTVIGEFTTARRAAFNKIGHGTP